MLAKLNKITSWQAALVITIIGFAVFFTGLTSPFQGDDINQIVNNVPVHSVSNIHLFFSGSTFYINQGPTSLSGLYYRPLMTTTFSLLYTLFGPHTFYFHMLQLLVFIGSAILLYLVFKYSFKPTLALSLALIFLVHPLNSQVAFALPYLQDTLLFFFGVLALWLLLRFHSVRSLWVVAASLFLSMLAKEAGIVFVTLSLLYLCWFNRERFYAFAGIVLLPVALYLGLRINAVGLFSGSPNTAPIDRADLATRLMTMPSMGLLYLEKFLFPWKLSSGYYWVYRMLSIDHVLIPLLIDLVVIGVLVYGGLMVRRKASRPQYYSYLFFAAWVVLELVIYLQFIPLDETASETWFFVPMAGLLGMIGIALGAFRIRATWVLSASVVAICLLGLCTAVRGLDWGNPVTLAYRDVGASSENYYAYQIIANSLDGQGKYASARTYALRSIDVYPNSYNYNVLGVALADSGHYSSAANAYSEGLKYSSYNLLYQNIGELSLVYGNPESNKRILLQGVQRYPQDSELWLFLALLEEQYQNNLDARISISKAASYGQVSQTIYHDVLADQPFSTDLTNMGKAVSI